jgi:quercetin dioxygenase-like cupin family protein
MAEMTIVRNSHAEGKETVRGGPDGDLKTFSGLAFVDPVYQDNRMSIANVTFSPSARTYWHTHEHGQILHVLAGAGWICDKGREPQRIKVGDTIVCPPGTTHWHGGDDGSHMVHTAISQGKAEWLEEVTDEDYAKKA